MNKKKLFWAQIGSDVIIESFADIGIINGVSFANRDLTVYQMSNEDLLGFSPYLDIDQNSIEVLEFLRGLYNGDFWYTMSLFLNNTECEVSPAFLNIFNNRDLFVSKRSARVVFGVAEAAFSRIFTMPETTMVRTIVNNNPKNINIPSAKKLVQKLGYNADMAYICIIVLKLAKLMLENKRGFISDIVYENREFHLNLYNGLYPEGAIRELYADTKNEVEMLIESSQLKSKPEKHLIDKLLKNIRNAR